MEILVTSPYVLWPPYFGGAVRSLNLVRALANMGHDVTLLTAEPAGPADEGGRGVEWRGYRAGSSFSHFHNPHFIQAYGKALALGPELVVAAFPYQARMIVGPARRAGIPVIYDAHNVEADRFRQLGRPGVALLLRWIESYLCRHARAVLVTSESDRDLLRRYFRVDSLVMPNGVDVNRFSPATPDESLRKQLGIGGCRIALFFGTFDYAPNLEALDFLVKQVWPQLTEQLPGARLLVVGRNPPDWASGRTGVVVTGAVDDIVAHIRLANVVVVPVFSGGGTRLKIIEALACGQTVLSTPFGAEGIASRSADGLMLSDRNSFADNLKALLLQSAEPCSNNASRHLALPYDWKAVVSQVNWNEMASPAIEHQSQ